jgi:NADPH2:quinone reductase
MKAWLLNSLNGLDAFQLVPNHPDPVAIPGSVILAIDFAALNPADRYLSEGQYPARPSFPHILGRDAVGTIIAIGPNVTHWKIGDRAMLLRGDVGVSTPGTFAEKTLVPADALIPVPANWTPPQAAGATLVYLTAYQALTQFGPLAPNSNVLITGASGGVGVAVVQLALAMDAKIVALSRSKDKRARLQEMGAIPFDPGDTQWRRQLKQALGERSIHLAIDNVGGSLFPELLDTLAMNGRVSVVGRLAGPVPNFNTASLFFRRICIGGVAAASYSNDQARTAWTAILALLQKSHAAPIVDSVFPFDQLKEAFHHLAAGPMGKVVLQIH